VLQYVRLLLLPALLCNGQSPRCPQHHQQLLWLRYEWCRLLEPLLLPLLVVLQVSMPLLRRAR
jgi:hypothetical protein